MATRPFADFYFAEFAPDQGGAPRETNPAYLTDCINLRWTPNGYRGMPTFANIASATAIGGAAMAYANGASFYTLSNLCFFVVTDSGTMYESRAEGTDTWQNVSPAVGTLDPFGDFVRFGNDVVHIGSTRAPIKKDITGAHATVFTSLGGSPPIANHAARVRQHLVLGNISAGVYTVKTSAIGNHEDWPIAGTADALAKESIEEALNPEFGQIIRVLGGEKFGIVMQEHALTRMTYVGGSSVYEFDAYERIDGGGQVLFSRPVTDGVLWYYYTETGLYATDGYSTKNVSEGKIDEALFTNTIAHPLGTQLNTAFTSVYDARRGNVMFGGAANIGGARYLLTYNVTSGACSLISDSNQMASFGGFNANATPKLGGRSVYNIGAADRKLQKLTGSAPTIALQTGYLELDPGYKTQFTGAHLLGTGVPGSLSLAHKSTSLLSATDLVQTGFTTMTANPRGMKSADRTTDQFHAFRVTGTGAESQLLKGIRVYFERGEPAT